jgi:hypothetical protein
LIQRERSLFWEMIISFIVRKNVHMNMYLILNDYRDRAVWIYKYKSILNGNKEREITYSYFDFNFNLMFKWKMLLYRNDRFVTPHSKCWKIPSTTMHFTALVPTSHVVCLSWSSHFFVRAAASKMRVTNFSCVSTFPFLNFAHHQTQQIKI